MIVAIFGYVMLLRVKILENIFEGADGVAGGDIVLVVEDVGAITSCPNTGNICLLSARINDDILAFIQINDTF